MFENIWLILKKMTCEQLVTRGTEVRDVNYALDSAFPIVELLMFRDWVR